MLQGTGMIVIYNPIYGWCYHAKGVSSSCSISIAKNIVQTFTQINRWSTILLKWIWENYKIIWNVTLLLLELHMIITIVWINQFSWKYWWNWSKRSWQSCRLVTVCWMVVLLMITMINSFSTILWGSNNNWSTAWYTWNMFDDNSLLRSVGPEETSLNTILQIVSCDEPNIMMNII